LPYLALLVAAAFWPPALVPAMLNTSWLVNTAPPPQENKKVLARTLISP